MVLGSAFPRTQDDPFAETARRGLRIVSGRGIQTVGSRTAARLITSEVKRCDRWHAAEPAATREPRGCTSRSSPGSPWPSPHARSKALASCTSTPNSTRTTAPAPATSRADERGGRVDRALPGLPAVPGHGHHAVAADGGIRCQTSAPERISTPATSGPSPRCSTPPSRPTFRSPVRPRFRCIRTPPWPGTRLFQVVDGGEASIAATYVQGRRLQP